MDGQYDAFAVVLVSLSIVLYRMPAWNWEPVFNPLLAFWKCDTFFQGVGIFPAWRILLKWTVNSLQSKSPSYLINSFGIPSDPCAFLFLIFLLFVVDCWLIFHITKVIKSNCFTTQVFYYSSPTTYLLQAIRLFYRA